MELSPRLATLSLGTPSLWARALPLLEPPPAPLPERKARRAASDIDALDLEVIGKGRIVRPQPGEGCDYGIVGGIAELREYLRPSFEDRIPFGADWETTSLNPSIAQPVGLSVSVLAKQARYVPVGHGLSPGSNLPMGEVLGVLRELDALRAHSLWYNAGYDLEVMLQALGWEPAHWTDVQIGVFLVNSNVIELNLKITALRLLGVRMQTLTELDDEWVTLSKKQQSLRPAKLPHELPVEKVAPYACADADCTRQIWFHKDVQKAVKNQRVIFDIEHALSPVMREGIRHGVYLDVPTLQTLQDDAKARITQLVPEIYALLQCEPFPLAKRALLGEKLAAIKAIGHQHPTSGEWVLPLTGKGQIVTNKKVLDTYRNQHPVVPKLIQYAELDAQERNYIRKLIKAAEHFATQPWAQGRVRFAFNAIGVPTGRMKCGGAGKGGVAYLKGMVDVNGQSVPEHEKAPYLPNTRSAWVAPPGYTLVALDYSQVELRIAANLSREKRWIDAYLKGEDLHTVNAQAIANVREPGITVSNDDKKRRGGAKATSFALLYGGDEHTIARNAGISVEEAKAILDAFFHGLPMLQGWIERTHVSARSARQVRTHFGRIRHLDAYFLPEPSKRHDFGLWKIWKKLDSRGCREAINDPIQGAAADIFKLACVQVARTVKAQGWGYDIVSPQVMWIHDELVVYVRTEWVTRVVPVLQAAMEFPIRGWVVPLKVEAEVGSRILYARGKAKKAEGADRERWQALAASPESSNWGEMVGYETWVQHYAPEAVAGAA